MSNPPGKSDGERSNPYRSPTQPCEGPWNRRHTAGSIVLTILLIPSTIAAFCCTCFATTRGITAVAPPFHDSAFFTAVGIGLLAGILAAVFVYRRVAAIVRSMKK